jgi:hypothetical protein
LDVEGKVGAQEGGAEERVREKNLLANTPAQPGQLYMGAAASLGQRQRLPRYLDVEDDYIRPAGHLVLGQVASRSEGSQLIDDEADSWCMCVHTTAVRGVESAYHVRLHARIHNAHGPRTRAH